MNQKIKLPDGREVTIRVQNAESYVPNPQNTNKGKERGKAALDDSLQNSGFHRGIVVAKDGTVINGNHTYQSASELGVVKSWIEVEVEGDVGVVTKRIDWKNAEDPNAILAAIADNRTSALNLEFDPEILEQALQQLEEAGKDIPDTILTKEEIEQLLTASNEWMNDEQNEGLTDPDEIPDEEFTETRVKRGDIWQLGRHRVMCGDSTIITDVERLMDGKKADLLHTDPPYGIKRSEGFEGFGGFGGFGAPIKRRRYNGDKWDEHRPPKECFDVALRFSKIAVIWGGNFFADFLPQGKHWLVWDKKNTMPTFGDAELAWTNVKRDSVKIKEFTYNGLIGKEKDRFHPTQKPVGLIADVTESYTEKDNLVLDLFLGSGTTLIACEKTGRVCYGMELSERYCDVILKRWEDFTGEKAVLHET